MATIKIQGAPTLTTARELASNDQLEVGQVFRDITTTDDDPCIYLLVEVKSEHYYLINLETGGVYSSTTTKGVIMSAFCTDLGDFVLLPEGVSVVLSNDKD